MISLNQFDEIFSPLLIRAQAPITFPNRGFRDMAAELLVKKLNLEPPADTYPWPDSNQAQNKLKFTHWIDKQLTDFFTHHPKACGIELMSGLSTRFQRVSMQLDWPQFNWIDVDRAEVVECAHLIFPQTDNHSFLCGEQWWGLAQLNGITHNSPLVIVLENSVQQDDAEKLLAWLQGLMSIAEQNNTRIRLVIDIPQLLEQDLVDYLSGKGTRQPQQPSSNIHPASVQIQLIRQCNFQKPSNWIEAMQNWIKRRFFKSNDERCGYVFELVPVNASKFLNTTGNSE